MTKNRHAVALGRRGGRVKSPRKAAAARANAAKSGGRPPEYAIRAFAIGADMANATAYVTKRGQEYPVRTLSARALAALAAWMRAHGAEAILAIDADGRVYFGREE